jgi:hypothetical protein
MLNVVMLNVIMLSVVLLLNRLKVTDGEKHSSLLQNGITCGRKKGL